ncbi:hypothetical protein AOLI_G00099990 [Acnodon oligacanthus]
MSYPVSFSTPRCGKRELLFFVFVTERRCENNMKTPVSVLRLPRGPEPNSRGFDPNSPRYIALCPTTIPASQGNKVDSVNLEEEQQLRSELRERFLRSLIAMTDKQVQFHLYEKVQVQAKFGASDIDVLNFQVSDLQTPLGVQKEALLRRWQNLMYLRRWVITCSSYMCRKREVELWFN